MRGLLITLVLVLSACTSVNDCAKACEPNGLDVHANTPISSYCSCQHQNEKTKN